MVKQDPQKSFYETLSRSGVKTKTGMKVAVKLKHGDVIIDNEVIYMWLMAINAKKKLPVERVMPFENSTVPLSIFHDDGLMVLPTKKPNQKPNVTSYIT